jgi:ABC-type transport system involved in multi-copper enzyme maturation permease subunit
MWWVAWRQHRLQIFAVIGLVAIIVVLLAIYRAGVIARFASSGCSLVDEQTSCQGPEDLQPFANSRDLWQSTIFPSWWTLLQMIVTATSVVLGVFVGAPPFSREFERGTHVLALTQSIGRRRWWLTRVTVAGVPLLVALLGLGVSMQWAASTTSITDSGLLGQGEFQSMSLMPMVFGLVSLVIAVTAGIVTRHTVAALVGGLVVAGVVVVSVGVVLYPHLLPPTRETAPVTEMFAPAPSQAGSEAAQGVASYRAEPDDNRLFLSSGYLDASGAAVVPNYQRCENPEWDQTRSVDENAAAQNAAALDCFQRQGIVSTYQDYLPGSMLWPLRWTVTGICVILAALFLGVAAWRLRPAVAKR